MTGVLRVGYVREHFSTPLLQFSDADGGKTFTLVECPSGTGQLISRLKNDEIDIAIALTDPLISGLANNQNTFSATPGADYKLVGSFVSTPLNWAVITGASTPYHKIADLQGRLWESQGMEGDSGSQTMAYVMALQQGWDVHDLKFQVNNDIRGLINSVNDNTTSAFMWEWFTTKPFADSGEVRFIGSVPTPWPSWLIAAHPSQTRAPTETVGSFLRSLSSYVHTFDSPVNRAKGQDESGGSIYSVKERFGYPVEDIQAWLATVRYPQDCASIPRKVIEDTLSVLEQAGVIKPRDGGYRPEEFVNTNVAILS